MRHQSQVAILALSVAAGAASLPGPAKAFYQQTNLVSDLPNVAEFQDPNLVNPWGMSSSSTSPIWVSDNGADKATLYNGAGVAQPVTPKPLVVSIPSGAPTGQVHNPTPGNFGGAAFIFASENGGIDSWKPADLTNAVNNVPTTPSSVYKGLALGTSSSGATLYATNFRSGKVDAFNSAFQPASLSGTFTDPNIPTGFAPFGIQNVGGNLVVTYALQDSAKHDDVAGPGNGYVDLYGPNGNLITRLVSGGMLTSPLNSPWGIALAPSNFGQFSGDLLVGNFGDGKINAFDPTTGAFRGTLDDASGNPIVIQGLWGLLFGNGGSGGATNELFFSAGIPGPPPGNIEDHGLFGTLNVPEPSTMALLLSGIGLLAVKRRRRG
jgi:uncharacterized protein (TIGR03118 family)